MISISSLIDDIVSDRNNIKFRNDVNFYCKLIQDGFNIIKVFIIKHYKSVYIILLHIEYVCNNKCIDIVEIIDFLKLYIKEKELSLYFISEGCEHILNMLFRYVHTAFDLYFDKNYKNVKSRLVNKCISKRLMNKYSSNKSLLYYPTYEIIKEECKEYYKCISSKEKNLFYNEQKNEISFLEYYSNKYHSIYVYNKERINVFNYLFLYKFKKYLHNNRISYTKIIFNCNNRKSIVI